MALIAKSTIQTRLAISDLSRNRQII